MAVAEVDLEMDDLFGDGQDVEELMDQPAEQFADEAVEVPEGEEAGQTQEGEGDMEVLNRLRDLSKGAAKKRVLKPQPKLDASRLQSDRGLPAIQKVFEKVKFKGKGHEKEDILKMMGTFEHWAHRLFPRAPFDEFIERLEKLGNKKPVQTTIKRIRMDMPILNDEFIGNEPEEDPAANGEAVVNDDDDNQNVVNAPELDAEEAYEEMIRQEREEQERQRATQERNERDAEEAAGGSPVRNSSQTDAPKTPAANVPSITGSSSLTAEQQERIERSKRLAMEKRMKKMGLTPGKSSVAQSPRNSSQTNSSENPPTSTTATPAVGAQRPDDAELADELLRDLDKDATIDNTNQELDLHLTENESVKDNSSSGSDGNNAAAGNMKNTEPDQNTEDLNLKLSNGAAEQPGDPCQENTNALHLHITESEATDSVSQKSRNDSVSEEPLVNGHNTTEDDSLLSEKSDKGAELKLKLSVSDSDAMDVDDN